MPPPIGSQITASLRLADDSVFALEGRSSGRVNHILASDLVTAAAVIVMPAAAGAASLTLQSDVVTAIAAAHPTVAGTAHLALANDVINAQAYAIKVAYADPFAATEAAGT